MIPVLAGKQMGGVEHHAVLLLTTVRGEPHKVALFAPDIFADESDDVVEGAPAPDWGKLVLIADKNYALDRPRLVDLKRPEQQCEVRKIDHRHLVDDDVVHRLVSIAPPHAGQWRASVKVVAEAAAVDPSVNRLRLPCGASGGLAA